MKKTGRGGEMRTLPCMACKQYNCNCFPIIQKTRYNEQNRDRNSYVKREFIAWDGEGITIEEPMYTVSRGRDYPPLYVDHMEPRWNHDELGKRVPNVDYTE